MRIVAVSDTHCRERFVAIPPGDVFVHAGDFGRSGSLKEFRPVAEWLRELPFAHKIIIAGNHDWCFTDELPRVRELIGPDVIYLQDSGVVIDGVTFWGSPWQPEFNGWAFNLPRGAPLAAKWALIPPETDVLITHGPPFGVGDRVAGSRPPQGCEDLLAAVQRLQPRLHLFGHIHEDGGLWTRDGVTFSNIACGGDARGASVFDFDRETRTVAPIEIPPNRPNTGGVRNAVS